ncbi:MAG: amino acid racemase [Lachnospiraceae bacterium]|nr:amino acid racemase [Lachnospiraceae bacterium]
MKTLGIIGGMGPMATAYFMTLITAMTDATTDQEHIRMLISSTPSIPDRTGYILHKSEQNPVPDIVREGCLLRVAGAQLLAMPCITAHFFHDELEEKIALPIINGIRETAVYLKERQIRKVGLMATDGTIQSHVFEKVLADYGISCIVPDDVYQRVVMKLIYEGIKAGKPVSPNEFSAVTEALKENGAEVVLLGCTELSVIKRDLPMPDHVLDVMEVLSRRCVLLCASLRDEYEELITGMP